MLLLVPNPKGYHNLSSNHEGRMLASLMKGGKEKGGVRSREKEEKKTHAKT
jgi:hypothetical protein